MLLDDFETDTKMMQQLRLRHRTPRTDRPRDSRSIFSQMLATTELSLRSCFDLGSAHACAQTVVYVSLCFENNLHTIVNGGRRRKRRRNKFSYGSCSKKKNTPKNPSQVRKLIVILHMFSALQKEVCTKHRLNMTPFLP